MRKKQNDTPMTEVDAKRIRRNAYIKMAAMAGIVAAVIAFSSIAWFTMNREVEGAGVQMRASGSRFEISSATVTIQSPKTNLPKIKESKASKAVVPDLEAVEVSDFKIRKSFAPCNE